MITETRPRPRVRALLALCSLCLPALAADTAPAPTAQYRVTFNATWSAASHPGEIAPGPHFSGIIGGTHDASVSFWSSGALASDGMEIMAELGGKSPLDDEIGAAITAGGAGVLISGGGISPSPGSVNRIFTASQTHPLVSLVSMIAPSPDWFVGVSGLPLFANGQWVSELVVSLQPYDAGTDDGIEFTSANADSQPPQPVSALAGYPFLSGVALGSFTFTRLDGPDTWSDLGGALAGAAGTPTLVGSGDLQSGQQVSLDAAGGLPLAQAALVIGASQLGLAFKGGTLVPNPDAIVFGLTLAGDGSLSLSAPWPAGIPAGLPLLLQLWITDAAGLAGFSATNAVCGVTS